VLISSGLIAGESLMAVILAFFVLGGEFLPSLVRLHEAVAPSFGPYFWLGLLVYPLLGYLLIWLPLKKMKEGGLPATRIE
jgi:hypothetical protein